MRIVIAIKQVPDTRSAQMDEGSCRVRREGVASMVNSADLHALELGLRLKRQLDAETIAISMGPPQAERALREALSLGIDRAILLSDKAFAGSDTWSTARVLSAAILKLGMVDMIICGERASDGETGQVGPELAAALKLPVLTYVSGFETDGTEYRSRRLTGHGTELHLGNFPVLLTVVKEIAVPGLPTLDGKIRARIIDIETWDRETLGIPTADLGPGGSPTRVTGIYTPELIRACRKLNANGSNETLQACRELRDWITSLEIN